MTTDTTTPPVRLSTVLPDDTVRLVGHGQAAPMRTADNAWGLVVRAVRLVPDTPHGQRTIGDKLGADDPRQVDTAQCFAAAWLGHEPDPALHAGDVVLRLREPLSGSAYRVDVEAFVAMDGLWVCLSAWRELDRRWPHYVAAKIHDAMAHVAAVDRRLALQRHDAVHSELADDQAPDALADLLAAGLLKIGSWLHCGINHRAVVAPGGVLAHECETPGPGAPVHAVHSFAAEAAGSPVNGWHLLRTSGGELLADLREQLAQP